MNYKYSIQTDSHEPIMLLDNEIGGDGINGAEFARELLELSNSADRVQLWINSIGGGVIDSYSIIAAIRKSPVPVDTYNLGMAASSSFNIFSQGRKRYIMDYAQVMTHNVIASGDAENWNNSVGTILASKSGKTLEEVKNLMNAETYMSADEAVQNGFADVIEYTGIKVDVSSITNLNEAQNKFKTAMLSVVNKLPKQVNNLNFNMKTVANKLGLNEAANEEQVLSAINKLEANKATALAEAQNAADKLIEVENKLKEANNKLAKVEKASQDAQKAALMEKATNLITEAQNAGRLPKGETEEVKAVVNKWQEILVTDFDGGKTLIETLPVNKKSPSLPINHVGEVHYSMQSAMTDINNKVNSK